MLCYRSRLVRFQTRPSQ